MEKIDLAKLCSFDTTPEELEKEGKIFVPHRGYSNPQAEIKRNHLWIAHLKNKSANT